MPIDIVPVEMDGQDTLAAPARMDVAAPNPSIDEVLAEHAEETQPTYAEVVKKRGRPAGSKDSAPRQRRKVQVIEAAPEPAPAPPPPPPPTPEPAAIVAAPTRQRAPRKPREPKPAKAE